MSELIQQTAVVGPLQCNCTLLACGKTREAVLIDPGEEAPKILAMLQEQGVKVKYLLHTHAHFDHIAATGAVQAQAGGTVCLHRADNDLFRNLPLQGRLFGMQFGETPEVQKFLEHEEELEFGEQKLRVIHTPGHSPGSICFEVQGSDGRVFSGDTLFRQSVGRADLWGGDGRQLISSIRERLLTLDGDVPVFPGHGPKTTIGFEKTSNPFLL
ncbi:MBL fold metallo-hydrolase [bacterium]|nr:MBL fold metallo-hydrolase [bacterium]